MYKVVTFYIITNNYLNTFIVAYILELRYFFFEEIMTNIIISKRQIQINLGGPRL